MRVSTNTSSEISAGINFISPKGNGSRVKSGMTC